MLGNTIPDLYLPLILSEQRKREPQMWDWPLCLKVIYLSVYLYSNVSSYSRYFPGPSEDTHIFSSLSLDRTPQSFPKGLPSVELNSRLLHQYPLGPLSFPFPQRFVSLVVNMFQRQCLPTPCVLVVPPCSSLNVKLTHPLHPLRSPYPTCSHPSIMSTTIHWTWSYHCCLSPYLRKLSIVP